LIAHTTIVFIRYLLRACQQRQAIDERTLDGVFRACMQELKDSTLAINGDSFLDFSGIMM